ncbi:MAG: hypothetical protein AB7G93_08930 [Bdellovibrionales bacterium]
MRFLCLSLIAALIVPIFVACARKEGRASGPPSGSKQPSAPPDNMVMTDGPGSGNGGKGVLIDGKPFLLDLVEGGVEKSPYFSPDVEVPKDIRDRLVKVFGHDSRFPIDLIGRKLIEVQNTFFQPGFLLLKSMELFRWRFVNLPPASVNDQREGLKANPRQYVQLGKRLQKTIIIDTNYWEQLNEGNRVALIFHEAAYAMARPIKMREGFFKQDTGAVQEFVAFLFMPPRDGSPRDRVTTLQAMMDRIKPENFDFTAGLIRNESIDTVFVTPTVHFYFTQEKSAKRIKEIDDISGVIIAHSFHEGSDFFVNWLEQAVCHDIPQGAALAYEIKKPYKDFVIDLYEGAGNQFYSYMKISDREGNELEAPRSITSESCKQVVVSQAQSIMVRLKSYTWIK